MKTLGVDLSSKPGNTAACVIEWGLGAALVHPPMRPCSADVVIGEIRAADVSALDAPFGWPVDFLRWVTLYSQGKPLPDVDAGRMRLRDTDRFVQQLRQAIATERKWRRPRWPLSVSADKIATTAVMAGKMLEATSPDGSVDRLGGHGVFEAYPAASLELFGVSPVGYRDKGDAGIAVRRGLLAEMEAAADWLQLDEALRAALTLSDHDLDAFICSLTARAAARGLTVPPETAEERKHAVVEGWIQVPRSPAVLAELGVSGG